MRKFCRILYFLSLAPFILLGGCAGPSAKHAFIAYWPPEGQLDTLRLAVKDNIDMAGVVTTAGSEYFAKNHPPAKTDAPALAIARQRNVQIVGKANLSEFAISPSGFNEHFGTPRSPLSRGSKLLPGGSSCGSAVAVAAGEADVAFGTDTAGSVRVPAACCGVVGLKTTHGLIPIEGVYPVEPQHLDTIGPLGKDIAHTVSGMDLLEAGFAGRYAAATAARPTADTIRIGRLRLKGTDSPIDKAVDAALAKAGFQVFTLSDDFRKKWEQAQADGNTVAAAGAWMSNRQYSGKSGVALRTKSVILYGHVAYLTGYRKALARQGEWQRTLQSIFEPVDFIALPTLQTTPPPFPKGLKLGLREAQMLDLQNTAAVNFAGNPALAVPIPLRRSKVRVTSLQLVGPKRSEAELLNAGRLVEAAVKNR